MFLSLGHTIETSQQLQTERTDSRFGLVKMWCVKEKQQFTLNTNTNQFHFKHRWIRFLIQFMHLPFNYYICWIFYISFVAAERIIAQWLNYPPEMVNWRAIWLEKKKQKKSSYSGYKYRHQWLMEGWTWKSKVHMQRFTVSWPRCNKAAYSLQRTAAAYRSSSQSILLCPHVGRAACDSSDSYLLRCLRAAGRPDSSSLRTYFLVPMQ